MRILLFYGNEDTDTDYIIQNYLPLPIFIGKTEKDCTIIITQYIPKFTLFWAENNYLFNSLFSSEITSYYFSKESKIYINNYIKLAQMNIRISSKYLPISEFYNVYLNQLNLKINFFIKQLYRGSELYECDTSDYDIHD